MTGVFFWVIIGNFLALVEIVYLIHKFPNMFQQHSWFEIEPEYEQNVVSIFKNNKNMNIFLLPSELNLGKNLKTQYIDSSLRVVFTVGKLFDINNRAAEEYLNSCILPTLERNDLCYKDCGVY